MTAPAHLLAPTSLSFEGDSGGTVTLTLEAIYPPFPSRPLPELVAGAPVEGKDDGSRASPFLFIPLSLSHTHTMKTCTVVMLLMVVTPYGWIWLPAG